ncbi:MAG: DUF937 domain-containing protein [Pseudomonadota bacterium]
MSLLEQLTGAALQQMAGGASRKTGVDAGLAEKLLPMAMTALMGGLKKNASNPDGAAALASALDRHDGGVLNDLGAVENDDVAADGEKILGHIFGGKQGATEQALAKTAGIDQAQMRQILAMAAPAVLGALGKAKRDQGLGAADLSRLVTQETDRAEAVAANELGGLMKFLDQDGDGDFRDELLEAAGKNLLGGLFGRK